MKFFTRMNVFYIPGFYYASWMKVTDIAVLIAILTTIASGIFYKDVNSFIVGAAILVAYSIFVSLYCYIPVLKHKFFKKQ